MTASELPDEVKKMIDDKGVKHAIKLLTASLVEKAVNAIFAADPGAMHALCEYRVPCDKKVETDTLAIPAAETADGPLSLGMLGVLNAVVGLHGLKLFAIYVCGTLAGFEVKIKEDGDGNSEAGVQGQHGPQL